MKTRRPAMTHAEHQANQLRKMVGGRNVIIRDLQAALKIARERASGAEREASMAWSACALLEHIACGAVAELPEERRAEWLAQFPGLKTKEETAC